MSNIKSERNGRRPWRRLVPATIGALAASCALAQTAQQAAPADELRICASENEAPYSIKDGTGFENRIAALVAETMGRKPVFIYTSRPAIYLVRDYLDKDQCDVVMGLDAGDDRVLTTRPYYRSGYVFVTRIDRDIRIRSWDDDRLAEMSRLAVPLGSPAEAMLKAIGKFENNMNYMYSLVNFRSPRNQYVRVDPARMVNEVAQGKADAAIAFGAEVARYVKSSVVPLRMELVPKDTVPDADGKTIEFNYGESMAVRKDDARLLAALDAAIEKAQPRITKLLEDEGVPLLQQAS